MRKLNISLILGSIIVIIIILVSMYPEYISPIDPFGVQQVEYTKINGQMTFILPPVSPCESYPWGSDQNGRDLRALIIYGCRVTMIIAFTTAILRMLIALVIGTWAAYGSKLMKWLIKQFNFVFGAFPMVLVIIVLIKSRALNTYFGSNRAMIFLLVFVGWSKLANNIMKRVEEILSKDFIEGEITLGKNKLEIAIQNILPHIISSMVVMFFVEVGLVLLLMVQIGILGSIAVSNYTRPGGYIIVPSEFDWATLLRHVSTYMFIGKYYLVVIPMAVFAISILGFNLLGEGLRIEFEKRTSRVISIIRRIPSFISPIRFIYEIRHIKTRRKPVVVKSIVILLILALVWFPHPKSRYVFEDNTISTQIKLNDMLSAPVVNYSQSEAEGSGVIDYIEETFKDNGLKPLGDSYIQGIGKYFSRYQSEYISFRVESSEYVFSYTYNKDFVMLQHNFEDATMSLQYLDADYIMLGNVNSEAEFKNKAILTDLRGKNIDRNEITEYLEKNVHPRGVIYIEDWEDNNDITSTISKYDPMFAITFSSAKAESLLKLKGDIDLSIFASKMDYDVNVIGCIPGSDEELKDDYVVIGTNLNTRYSLSYNKYIARNVAFELELLKSFIKSGVQPKRTIVFAFWGGTNRNNRGTETFVWKNLYNKAESAHYIAINDLGWSGPEQLIADTSEMVPDDAFGQSLVRTLGFTSKNNDIKLINKTIITNDKLDFGRSPQSMIVIKGISGVKKNFIQNLFKHDTSQNLQKTGQILLDVIIKAAEAI